MVAIDASSENLTDGIWGCAALPQGDSDAQPLRMMDKSILEI